MQLALVPLKLVADVIWRLLLWVQWYNAGAVLCRMQDHAVLTVECHALMTRSQDNVNGTAAAADTPAGPPKPMPGAPYGRLLRPP